LTLAPKFNYSSIDLTSEIVVIDGTAYARNYFGFVYDGNADKVDIVAFVSGYGG
jgi:hypothetical protein